MSITEVRQVSEYFKDEIFSPLSSTVLELEFDKRIHRGINGEFRGRLSKDRALLIPSCKVEDMKMVVKLD